MKTPAPFNRLSDKQLAAVTLLVSGASNVAIAAHLGCSVKTVDTHLYNARTKIGIHDRVALARKAIRVGLVTSCEEDDFFPSVEAA